ncbi:unnamed protein product [Urochloa humidicola]
MKHGRVPIGDGVVDKAIVLEMYSDLGKEPSAALLRRLQSIDARRRQAAGSPQGCSHSVDGRHNDENMEERDDDDNSHGSEEDSDGDTADEELDQERGADDNEVSKGDC